MGNALKVKERNLNMLPNFFWLLYMVDQAFLKNAKQSVIHPEPLQVQNAKIEFMNSKEKSSIDDWMEQLCPTTNQCRVQDTADYKKATTWSNLLKDFAKFMENSHTKQQCQDIFQREFEQVTSNGRRGLVQPKKGGKRGFYKMLRED